MLKLENFGVEKISIFINVLTLFGLERLTSRKMLE